MTAKVTISVDAYRRVVAQRDELVAALSGWLAAEDGFADACGSGDLDEAIHVARTALAKAGAA